MSKLTASVQMIRAIAILEDPFPTLPVREITYAYPPGAVEGVRWRIKQAGQFQGGEWLTAEAAMIWGCRQVRGAFAVVQCDIWGVEVQSGP